MTPPRRRDDLPRDARLDRLLERLRQKQPAPGAAAGMLAVPSAGDELAGEVSFLFVDLDEIERERADAARGGAIRGDRGRADGSPRAQAPPGPGARGRRATGGGGDRRAARHENKARSQRCSPRLIVTQRGSVHVPAERMPALGCGDRGAIAGGCALKPAWTAGVTRARLLLEPPHRPRTGEHGRRLPIPGRRPGGAGRQRLRRARPGRSGSRGGGAWRRRARCSGTFGSSPAGFPRPVPRWCGRSPGGSSWLTSTLAWPRSPATAASRRRSRSARSRRRGAPPSRRARSRSWPTPLAGSAWALPRAHSPAELAIGLRVAWGRRVAESAPEAADWVAGAVALLAARELLVAQSSAHAEQLRRYPGIDDRALSAAHARRACAARWALGPVGRSARSPSRTSSGEPSSAWWDRVEEDSRLLLRRVGRRGGRARGGRAAGGRRPAHRSRAPVGSAGSGSAVSGAAR